jgi:hypothetical protein
MAQLNVSFDDALLAEVDRLAAERGISRPELLRALVREAIGAEGKVGGAVVVPPPVAPEPLLVTTPQFLSSLEQMALDLDRVLRDMDRREVRLGKALAARAALDASAEAKLASLIAERVDGRLVGFEHRVTKQLARLPSEVAMQDILARLEQNVQTLAKQPPPPPLVDPTSLAAQFVAILAGALLALMLFWGLLHRYPWQVVVPTKPDPAEVIDLRSETTSPKHRSKNP